LQAIREGFEKVVAYWERQELNDQGGPSLSKVGFLVRLTQGHNGALTSREERLLGAHLVNSGFFASIPDNSTPSQSGDESAMTPSASQSPLPLIQQTEDQGDSQLPEDQSHLDVPHSQNTHFLLLQKD
jgi:hypothetical protein